MYQTKICTKCKEEKELAYFGKSNRTKNGLQNHCKKCISKQANEIKARKTPNIKPENGYKVCSKCELKKHVDEFYINPNLSMGVHSECILCTKEKVSLWAKNNPDKMAINGKKYRDSHKTEEQLRAKKYVQYNREERVIYNISWKQQNKEKISKQTKDRRVSDPLFKLRGVIRCSIKDSFKRACKGVFKKSKTSEVVLKCKFEDFMIHLQRQFLNWMTFENHGNCEEYSYNCSWNIDHIIPISYAKTEAEVYMLNHWSNFQPLCSKINTVHKSDTIYPCTNLELRITFWEDHYEYI